MPPQVAFYILNQKRTELTAIEARYEFRVLIEADETLIPPGSQDRKDGFQGRRGRRRGNGSR